MPKKLINIGTEKPVLVSETDVKVVITEDVAVVIPDEERDASFVDLTKKINDQPFEQL